jgi:hypothetical protein
MEKNRNESKEELILNELDKIKNLLILGLYGMNFPSSEIGKAANVGSSTVRKMFNKKEIIRAQNKKGVENEES